MSFSTEIVINAVVYCACVLDPILYFVANPDYRAAVRAAWGDMYCNKDPVEVSANDDEKRPKRSFKDLQKKLNTIARIWSGFYQVVKEMGGLMKSNINDAKDSKT